MSPIDWGRGRSRTVSLGTDTVWWTNTTGTAEHGLTPAQPPQSQWTWQLGQEVQTTMDFVTPKFLSQIQAGVVINNPYLTEKTVSSSSNPSPMSVRTRDTRSNMRIYCSTCKVYHDRITDLVGNWGQVKIPFLESIPGVDELSMRTQVMGLATTQAHANIDVSEMLALVTAIESHKTVDSMVSILGRAARIFRNVRKLNIRGLRKELTPKELADRYMEMRYAIRPLIYDCEGVAKSLQKARGYERRTFRGYSELSAHAKDTILGTGSPVSDDWARSIDVVYSARAGILCDVSITDLNIYGYDRVGNTIWEVVPFSFIADWFANVGDWVAAHTPDAGVTQRASWVTVRKQRTLTQQVVNSRWNLPVGVFPVSLLRPASWHKIEETVLERVVDPVLNTWPTTKLRLDMYKLTDLGIILRNILR